MNVKQIVSRMGRKEKKEESDFRLSISALTVENLEFRLEKLQHRNPVYGIDFSDMDIRDIDAVIDNFTIDGGAVGAEIGRFSAREKSGFEIDDFGGKFFLANGCIGMENARLVTPHSNVSDPCGLDRGRFVGRIQGVCRSGEHDGRGAQFDAFERRRSLLLAQVARLAADVAQPSTCSSTAWFPISTPI